MATNVSREGKEGVSARRVPSLKVTRSRGPTLLIEALADRLG